jgi:SAM-dependent methyltransferase
VLERGPAHAEYEVSGVSRTVIQLGLRAHRARHATRMLASSPVSTRSAAEEFLSLIVVSRKDRKRLAERLSRLHAVAASLGIDHELLVISARSGTTARSLASMTNVRVIQSPASRFGTALSAGLRAAGGTHVLVLDDDTLETPEIVRDLWSHRDRGDVIIGSRYITGSHLDAPVSRRVPSLWLNRTFSRGLSLTIHDLSSVPRLFRARVLQPERYRATGFDILQEILVDAYAEGWRIIEVPIRTHQRRAYRRLLGFGAHYTSSFWRLWKLRNSIECADYDARAHDSPIPLQRYWQRQRYRHVTELIAGAGPVLDVGCGSSRIIGALPPGSVAVDVLMRKLRYARRFRAMLVNASGFDLPFPDRSFPCVLCSQVIEHVPKSSSILAELDRVLQPGGRLVLGTPDYAQWQWRVTETLYGWAAPGAYADEHISHYTRRELVDHFTARGYTHEETRYILRGELILAFTKGDAALGL